MKILLMKPGIYEQPDLEEFFLGMQYEVGTALDVQSLSRQLCLGQVDVLLYSVTELADFHVIRYVNEHYPEVAVVIAAENGMGAEIDNVRRCSFGAVRKPYRLNDLGSFISSYAGAKQ